MEEIRQQINSQISTGWQPVISITMTLAVTGDWVAPAKKAAMQSNTSNRWSIKPSLKDATCTPKPAPMVKEGVKIPPAIPVQ